MARRHDRRTRDDSVREPGVRNQRLEEIFREELNSILEADVSDPRLEGARITMVELSPDGARARVWFALERHEGELDGGSTGARAAEAAFARAAGFLRSRLCEALPLKRMPELRFRYDPAIDPGALQQALEDG